MSSGIFLSQLVEELLDLLHRGLASPGPGQFEERHLWFEEHALAGINNFQFRTLNDAYFLRTSIGIVI